MLLVIKIAVGLLALLFGVMGFNLMFDPAAAAVGFAVTPLGEAGLNTVRGDLGGLFVGSATVLVLGLALGRSAWFVPVAIVMILIALGRVIGFAIDGSPVSANITAFVAELIITAVLVVAARILPDKGNSPPAA